MGCPSWSNIKVALASTHYATLIFALIIYVIVSVVRGSTDPFRRDWVYTDGTIRFPTHDDTIPFWLTIAFTLPTCMALFYCENQRCRSMENYDILWLYNGWLLSVDLVSSCLFTFNVVESAKLAIGQLRPDFIARCRPQISGLNTNQLLNAANLPCTSSQDEESKGRTGFPSGHTAQCFALAVYYTSYMLWYQYVRKRMQGQRRTAENGDSCCSWCMKELAELWRLIVIFIPLGIAFYVGLTRVRDNHHSVDDLLGGILIGGVFSIIFFVRALFAFVAVPHEDGNALPHVRDSLKRAEQIAMASPSASVTYTKEHSTL